MVGMNCWATTRSAGSKPIIGGLELRSAGPMAGDRSSPLGDRLATKTANGRGPPPGRSCGRARDGTGRFGAGQRSVAGRADDIDI